MIRSIQLPPIRRGKQGDSRGTNEFPWNSRANTLARCRSWKPGLGGRGPGILGALNKVAFAAWKHPAAPRRNADASLGNCLGIFRGENEGISRDFYHPRPATKFYGLWSTNLGPRSSVCLELGVVFNATALPFSSLLEQLSRKQGDHE